MTAIALTRTYRFSSWPDESRISSNRAMPALIKNCVIPSLPVYPLSVTLSPQWRLLTELACELVRASLLWDHRIPMPWDQREPWEGTWYIGCLQFLARWHTKTMSFTGPFSRGSLPLTLKIFNMSRLPTTIQHAIIPHQSIHGSMNSQKRATVSALHSSMDDETSPRTEEDVWPGLYHEAL